MTDIRANVANPSIELNVAAGPRGQRGQPGPPAVLSSLWLPGVATDRAQTPTALSLANGLDLRWRAQWASGVRAIVSQWPGPFRLYQNGNNLILHVSSDGTATDLVNLTYSHAAWETPAVGTWVTGRITWDRTTGNTTTYISDDGGATWRQIATNPATAGTPSTSGTPVVGGGSTGGQNPFLGAIAWVEVRNFAGDLLAGCDFTIPWDTRYRDPAGNTWTLNGTGWAWVQGPGSVGLQGPRGLTGPQGNPGLTGEPGPNSGAGTIEARPTAAAVPAGYIYYATNWQGGTLFRSDGATWTQINPAGDAVGGARLNYGELATTIDTNSISADTDILSLNVTTGSKPVRLAAHGTLGVGGTVPGGGIIPVLMCMEDGTRIGNIQMLLAMTGNWINVSWFRWRSPTPGNHTYTVRLPARTDGATVTAAGVNFMVVGLEPIRLEVVEG